MLGVDLGTVANPLAAENEEEDKSGSIDGGSPQQGPPSQGCKP